MNKEIEKFIKENINLIQGQRWEEIYRKDFPDGFTETLLDCGINPLEQRLNYIPDKFLYECEDIKEFMIPDSVISIGVRAFYCCTSLTNVTIGNSVTSIGSLSFSNCTKLTNVVVGDSVKSIGNYAFSSCDSLTSITIPNSVTSIGSYAFYDCDLLTSVTIGNSVTSIGYEAFAYCTNLKEIIYNGTKEEALTKLKVKNEEWREDSSIKKIICTDGVIEL